MVTSLYSFHDNFRPSTHFICKGQFVFNSESYALMSKALSCLASREVNNIA